MPPSPVVMFFVSCSEQAPSAPRVPDVAVVVRHADRLRRVLEERVRRPAPRPTRERVHVRGDVLEVDGDDRGRAFRDLRRDIGRIEGEGFVHFGEHRRRRPS